MKYVDASGQGLSTQMGQVISAGNPETLFVRSGPLMVCFFFLLWGLTLEDGRGTGTFSASAGLARFQI